jgi:hypothetical protein
MDNNTEHGYCQECGGTMSLHINVDKPLNHYFAHKFDAAGDIVPMVASN